MVKDYILRASGYTGNYPSLSVFFGALHQDWTCDYSSIDKLMLDWLKSDSGEDREVLDLHSELTEILRKDAKEQFEIFESFHCSGMYIDHGHRATLMFLSLLHFTENELRKRNIPFEQLE